MRRPQPLGRLDRDVEGCVEFQRALFDFGAHLGAVDVAHGEKGAAVGFADFVHHADIGVIERSCGFRLAQEALFVLVAFEQMGG